MQDKLLVKLSQDDIMEAIATKAMQMAIRHNPIKAGMQPATRVKIIATDNNEGSLDLSAEISLDYSPKAEGSADDNS